MNTAVRPSDDEYIPVKRFAALVHKRVESIYNARSRGEDLPPMYKIGKYVLMRKSEVDVWLLKQREVTASAQLAQQTQSSAAVPKPLSMIHKPWEARTANPR